jgi:hypothetical protein
MATATAEHATKSAPANGPILVDLGKKSRKKVKRLRDGEGKLMDKVKSVMDELRSNGTLKTDAQPVLIIVRERAKKRKGPGLMFR